jgi:hypothetical protein
LRRGDRGRLSPTRYSSRSTLTLLDVASSFEMAVATIG